MPPITRPKQNHQGTAQVPYDHAAQSATAPVKIWGALTRAHRVERVWYNNPTGFAASATDYWTVSITDGTNTLASWSTQTTGAGGNGALSADTPVHLVVSTSKTDFAAAAPLVAVFTKTGTPANLPAGRLVVSATPL